ncbi:MAG TPA: DUF2167 domain-containing protein [Usitatibacteraceae bacterium]
MPQLIANVAIPRRIFKLRSLAVGLGLLTATVFAQDKPTPESQVQAAFEAARSVAQKGPVEVKLIDQAKLKLPEGYVYIPGAQAQAILKAMGNRVGKEVIGMIFPNGDDNANWFMVASYEDSGYIKDDDAKDWNADDLLKSIKAGTDSANEDRRERGIPESEIIGWVEKPTYDAANRRLVWSLASKTKGAPANAEQTINYNTYALGRKGYISMNLVTDLSTVENEKPIARKMLAALDFDEGKRYADFNSSTDKVAEYGLAALVAGVAAKKLGLFAVIAAFFLKFAKVAILAGGALLVGIGKWWKARTGKSDTPPQP